MITITPHTSHPLAYARGLKKNLNAILLVLLGVLIVVMYYWMTQELNSATITLSMLMMVGLAYWIGRLHRKIIDSCSSGISGEIN